jgi:DNA-binding protein HU-alpha
MATAKTSGPSRAQGTDAAAVAEPAEPAAGPPAEVAAPRPRLRKKELVARVASLSGARKSAVRPIVEATLAALGDALAAGDELVLPPFGKLRVNRQRDLPTGAVMTLRLRRRAAVPDTAPDTAPGIDGTAGPVEAGDEPLAKAGK